MTATPKLSISNNNNLIAADSTISVELGRDCSFLFHVVSGGQLNGSWWSHLQTLHLAGGWVSISTTLSGAWLLILVGSGEAANPSVLEGHSTLRGNVPRSGSERPSLQGKVPLTIFLSSKGVTSPVHMGGEGKGLLPPERRRYGDKGAASSYGPRPQRRSC